MVDDLSRILAVVLAAVPALDVDATGYADTAADAVWLASLAVAEQGTDTQEPETPPPTREAPPATPSAAGAEPAIAPIEQSPYQLYDDLASAIGTPQRVREVAVAGARSLPQRLALARSFRPFRRQWPRGRRSTLDIDATADAYARSGELIPIFTPAPERWFDADIVMERTAAMSVWDATVAEFSTLLTQLGAFRSVRGWHLVDDGADLGLCDPADAKRIAPPRLLCSPSARRLIILVSDAESPRWRRQPLWTLLRSWAASTPTLIVNPLPSRTWRYDSLGLPIARVGPGTRGGSNTSLNFRDFMPFGLPSRDAQEPGHEPVGADAQAGRWVPVPVVPLTPNAAATWANVLMNRSPATCAAVLVPPTAPAEPPRDAGADERTTDDVIRGFDDLASPAAVRLAVLCSPHSSLSPALLNLIRQHMVPEATLSDVAELLVSGIVTAEAGRLRFRSGVAESLRGRLAKRDAWRVFDLLSRHVADTLGARFPAVVSDVVGLRSIPSDLEPFAQASRETLRLLGVDPDEPPAEQPTDPHKAPEGDGEDPGAGSDAARRVVEAPVLVLGNRGVGKTSLISVLVGGGFPEAKLSTSPGGLSMVTYVSTGDVPAVTLRFWDIDIGRDGPAVERVLIRANAVYLLVADVRRPATADLVRRIHAQAGDDVRIVVATTHGDDQPMRSDLSTVPEKIDGLRINHVTVDAMSGIGVVTLLRTLADAARSLRPATGPGSQADRAVRQELETLAAHRRYISLTEYRDLAAGHGLPARATAALLSDLQAIGQVVTTGGAAEDLAVLDPTWLVGAVSDILRDPRIEENGGILLHAWLAGLDLPPAGRTSVRPEAALLRLMARAGITRPLTDGERSLVADRLPAERPARADELSRAAPSTPGVKSTRLSFAERPADLVAELIVDAWPMFWVTAWRDGMLLRPSDSAAPDEALVATAADNDLLVTAGPALLARVVTMVTHLAAARWPAVACTAEPVPPPTRAPAEAAEPPTRSDIPRYHFYLSHPRSLWTGGAEVRAEGDYWVRMFFGDLQAEVRRLTSRRGVDIGFYGDLVPPAADELHELGTALSGATVFVPLCSEEYRNSTLPMGELTAFRQRAAALPRPDTHIVPVLWSPTSPQTIAALGDPFDWAGDIGEYRQYGLQALCRLAYLAPAYAAVLERLARRIVEIVENSPLEPTDTRIALTPVEAEQAFTIAVLAPTLAESGGTQPSRYGDRRALWRPYRSDLVAANLAVVAVEDLGLPARVDEEVATTGRMPAGPGILLIDPWTLAAGAGESNLRRIVDRLPEWTASLAAIDRHDERYPRDGEELVARVAAVLQEARMTLRVAADAADFAQLVRMTVSDAWRRFLRWGPVLAPEAPPADEPRLHAFGLGTADS